MAALEGEHRRDKVAAILSAAQIKEGFDERVNSLAKSNLPLEEISVIYKPYLEANSNTQVKQASTSNTGNNNEQVPKKEVQYVESKVTMKSAATEPASTQKPAWLAARDYLMEGYA